jgi:hypothetical protein
VFDAVLAETPVRCACGIVCKLVAIGAVSGGNNVYTGCAVECMLCAPCGGG